MVPRREDGLLRETEGEKGPGYWRVEQGEEGVLEEARQEREIVIMQKKKYSRLTSKYVRTTTTAFFPSGQIA